MGDKEEKLTGADYFNRSLLELSSHPDYDYDAMRIIMGLSRLTTEELKSLTIIGGGISHQEHFEFGGT